MRRPVSTLRHIVWRARAAQGRLAAIERELAVVSAELAELRGGLRWPGQLAAVRAEPDYEHARTDPEPLVSVRVAIFDRTIRPVAEALAVTHESVFRLRDSERAHLAAGAGDDFEIFRIGSR